MRKLVRFLFQKAPIAAVVAIVISFLPLRQAHASLFSFLSSLFNSIGSEDVLGHPRVSPADHALSLASMPVLEAPTNADSKAARGGASLPIVDGNTLLPIGGPLASTGDHEEIHTDRITLYTVREGDNISVIAHMFGVSVNTIVWANDIKKGDLIQPGDVLLILPVSGIKHTVAKGDTLESIAKKHKGDREEILAINNLSSSDALEVGSEIIIPDGEPVIEASSISSSRKVAINAGALRDAIGYYMRPVAGSVRSQGIHGYNAVDLAAPCGTPIYAAAAGTVIVSRGYGWNGGYGNYIVITHANGTQTLYAHNMANWVTAGRYVNQGHAIGAVGSTGRSSGCHVHFEVRGAKNPF